MLTDYNPHGMALMLVYKYGSTHAGLDGYACPALCWLGLVAGDVLEPLPRSLFGGDRADAERMLPPEDFQPFTPRDRSVLDGLRQRSAVREDGARRLSPPSELAKQSSQPAHNHIRQPAIASRS